MIRKKFKDQNQSLISLRQDHVEKLALLDIGEYTIRLANYQYTSIHNLDIPHPVDEKFTDLTELLLETYCNDSCALSLCNNLCLNERSGH